MRLATILLGFAACSASSAQASDGFALVCTFSSKNQCGPNGCASVRPTITVSIDFQGRRYRRCDARGCDVWDGYVSASGIWRTIEAPGRAMFARVNSDNEIVEVATLNDMVLISHGRCTANR